MNHVEVTLYFNELRLRAVEQALADDGLTLEDKLKEHLPTVSIIQAARNNMAI